MWICRTCHARFRARLERCPLDGGELEALRDPLLGRRLAGRYLVEERLGEGGMSTVYRARHEVIGRDVAIKVLSPSLLSDPSSRSRLLREARAVNRIAHDHIIDISDYGETEDGQIYLVMEYLRGRPLDEAIRREGPFPVARAMEIARQVCLALGRAHHAGVVHRDVKPENVFLLDRADGADFVKLLDFGLAHVKGEGRITATGAVFGTPDYMSPEQVRGQKASARSDLYAVGCLLFEMLMRRPPFMGTTAAVLRGHLHEPIPSLREARSDVPESLEKLLNSLLAKDPVQRPPSALLVADRLDALLRGFRSGSGEWVAASPSKPPPAPPSSEPQPSERSAPRSPKSPSLGGSTLDAVAVWEARLSRFRSLLARLPHDSPERAGLRNAIEELARIVARMGALREALRSRDSSHEERRRARRSVQQRIGAALDALSRDEARLRERLEAARSELEATEHRRAEAARELCRRWRALEAGPSEEELSRASVEALAEAAGSAKRWLELDEAGRVQRAEVERMVLESEDLRFQIAQLRGRLASLGAEDDFERGDDIDPSIRTELATLHDDASRCVEPLVRRLLALPGVREDLLGPPPGEATLEDDGGGAPPPFSAR